MRTWHIRPAGIRRNNLAWVCLALVFCGGSCAETGNSRNDLDTRWTQFAQHRYHPLHEHQLREIRVVDVVTAFSDDRNLLAYSSLSSFSSRGNNAIHVIEVKSGRELSTLDGHPSTQCMAFTRDGRGLVSGGERCVKYWNITESKEISQANAHKGYVRCIVCSPLNDAAASGGDDGEIVIWDLDPLQVLKRITGHSGGVRCLRWSSDGRSILSGSWDGSIRLWSVSNGTLQFTGQTRFGRVMSLDLSPDGQFALSTYLDGPNQPVILWDIERKREISRFGVPGNPWWADRQLHIASVAFSPDGHTALFGAVFGSVIWWDVRNWKQIEHSVMHEKELTDVTFSADGKQAISVGGDIGAVTLVSVWELPDYSGKGKEREARKLGDK